MNSIKNQYYELLLKEDDAKKSLEDSNKTDKTELVTKEIEELMAVFLDLLLRFKSDALPEKWCKYESVTQVYNYIDDIKKSLTSFASGRLDFELKQKGVTAGLVKSLKASLNHLSWKLNAVAEGDLTQKVDYLGEFSEVFNKMSKSLEKQRKTLECQQKQLYELTRKLKIEIKERDAVEQALRTSEETYRKMALYDSLTGIYNRGYFFEAAMQEFEDIKRNSGNLCLLMIDVDFFKNFNDAYGHISGDSALKFLTDIISTILRKTDLFGRYGGEEFIILLHNSSLQAGLDIAERIRNLIATSPYPAEDVPNPITVSIGVSHISGEHLFYDSRSAKYLLNEYVLQADLALYKAKELGRNRVEYYS